MNETRYAHDTYLQLLSSWGSWAIVPLAALLIAFGRRLRAAFRRRDDDLPCLAAAASFLSHNLVDFTAYLPSVALPGALLVGLSLRPVERPAPARGGPLRTGPALLAVALAVFAGQSLLAAVASDRLQRAAEAALEGSREEALSLARAACRWRPGDPAPRAFIAEWVLAHGMEDEALAKEGRRQAESAVALDPEAAVLHYDLSLFLRADRETGASYRELSSARALFPLKAEYRLPDVTRADGGGAP